MQVPRDIPPPSRSPAPPPQSPATPPKADQPETAAQQAVPEQAPDPSEAEEQSPVGSADATDVDPEHKPHAGEPASSTPAAFDDEPPLGDGPVASPDPAPSPETLAAEESHFDPEPPFRRRRNPLKLWTWAAAIFAIVAAGIIFAASYWGLPSWVPVSRPIFGPAQANLQLDFPTNRQIKRKLPNGSEYFGVSGTITNIGKTAQNVPDILIVLRDARDRIVYSWEVIPPKRTLGPGASEAVNEAVTEIPRSARVAEIGWKPR